MQIGKPLRTMIVEPLESPVPATIHDPEPDPCSITCADLVTQNPPKQSGPDSRRWHSLCTGQEKRTMHKRGV